MRLRYLLPLALIFVMPASGARTTEKGIKFPDRPVAPVPAPVPVPAPAPGEVEKLNKGELYVIESPEPFFVKAVGDGQVSIERVAGPVTIYAQFAFGNAKYERRTFAGANVAIVTGAGSGRLSLVVVPGTVKSDADVVVKPIDVDAGTGPIPPPGPTPTPVPPAPTPPPAPVNPYPADKLRVMMIYESEDTMLPKDRAVLSSTIVEKAIKDAGGEFRRWDKNVDYSKEAEFWKKAMDSGKDKFSKGAFYVIISSPKGFTEWKPSSVEDFIATINKHKG